MEKAYQFIIENTASGKINRDLAIELIKILKQAEETFQPVAVIGVAARLPLADNPQAFWNIICNQRDCIRSCPDERRRDIESYLHYKKLPIGAAKYQEIAYLDDIDKFDPYFFRLSPKEASLMDPNQRLFLETAWSAIEDAGYGGNKLTGSKTGVYLGYSHSSAVNYHQLVAEIEPESLVGAVSGNIPAVIASRISYLLDLKGPALLIDTACSSSLVAAHLACQGLRRHDCELAIAGGVKVELAPFTSDYKLGIESSDGRTKTFDKDSDGTGGGEGVIALLLKPLDKALKDEDHIYAVIKGSAINQDGSSIGITAPNVTAQESVIQKAWETAGIDPETITYLEAHGTGTTLGDPIEIEGISRAFGQYTKKRQFCAIGSVKSNIGHLDHAAGLAGLLKAILALKYRQIPPTIHFQQPNRKITFEESPVYVNDRIIPWETGDFPRRVGVSSFGLSGTNCHMVLEESPVMTPADEPPPRPQIFTLSAKSIPALKQYLKAYQSYLETETGIELARICYTANTGRGHYNHRLALIVKGVEEFKAKIRRLVEADVTRVDGDDIFYGFHQVIGAVNHPNESGYLTNDQKLKLTGEASQTIQQLRLDGEDSVYLEQMRKLAKTYVQGADLPWEKIYEGEKIQKISLPSYAFEPNRCWVEIPAMAPEEPAHYVQKWVPETLELSSNNSTANPILIIHDQKSPGEGMATCLKKEGREVICAEYGLARAGRFEKIGPNRYEIDGSKESFAGLLQEINEQKLTQILYFTGAHPQITRVADLDQNRPNGIHDFLNLVQAILGGQSKEPLEIFVVAQRVHRVTGAEDGLNPEPATLFGLGKIVNLENPHIKCRCLDIDIDPEAGIKQIMDELRWDSHAYLTAYRNNQRYIETVTPLAIETIPELATSLKQDGVYIITGGMGGIGLELGKYLALQHPIQIALVNRSPLPGREHWDQLRGAGTDVNLNQKIKMIQEMEQSGSKVTCYRADVSKRAELEPVIGEITRKYGKINGIIHAAGIGSQASVAALTKESLDQVLAAKVTGTWLLDQLTQSHDLDFYILCSSAITIVGGVGVGAYTAANSYQDAFAEYRRLKGKRTLAVNWPTWKDTGMAKGIMVNEEKQIFKVITPGQAVNAFEKIFRKDLSNVIIGAINYSSPVLAIRDHLTLQFSAEIEASIQTAKNQGKASKSPPKSAPVIVKGQTSGGYTEIQLKLAQIWGKVFGLDEVSIYMNFAELGGDSILALNLTREIETVYPGMIDITHVFSYPTIVEMAGFITKKLTAKDSPSGSEALHILDSLTKGELSVDEVAELMERLGANHGIN
ncbi:MAG TPA: SDR family NAD(P)-dependent oxidoreductase [Bacillota bacterium]|nr:SDR family NAD(P)-dependent oxidoreductase [Bacillota bacterium]